MPQLKNALKLNLLCLNNIVENIDCFWIEKTGLMLVLEMMPSMRYLKGPFEILSDDNIEYIIRSLSAKNQLTIYHLYLCLHMNLKKLDLSYVKKTLLNNSSLITFIGNNCFKLQSLNISGQIKLTSTKIYRLIHSLKHAKHLDLSHTQANEMVINKIKQKCRNIQDLNLENCKNMPQECLLELCKKYGQQLCALNIENIFIESECLKEMLTLCSNLKSISADGFVKTLSQEFNDNQNYEILKIEKLKIDNKQIHLNNNVMSAIAYKCPMLKLFHINTFGSYQILSFMNSFEYISELVICNTSVIAYKMSVHLQTFFTTHGKKLKHLHLVHLPDVNVKYLIKHCCNLCKLILELVHYYEPCADCGSLSEDHHLACLTLDNLKHVHISNLNTSSIQPYVNVDAFKSELLMLIRKSPNLKYLKLDSLSFIDAVYLEDLCFFNLSKTIECIELKELNFLTIDNKFIDDFLLDPSNNLLKISFLNCHQITQKDFLKISKLLSISNFNCQINWS